VYVHHLHYNVIVARYEVLMWCPEVPDLWGYYNVPIGKKLPNMTSQYGGAHLTKVK